MVSDDKHCDLVFQHYKDCFAYLQTQLGNRVKLLVVIFAVQIAFVLRISYPSSFSAISSAWISHLAGSPSDLARWLEPHFLDSLLWFVLSCFMTEMYSRSLVIEREAAYLRSLEERLCAVLPARSITRSTEYRGNPISYIRKANTFYLFGSLTLMLFVAITKLSVELWQARVGGWPAWIPAGLDVTMFGVIVYFSVEFSRSFPRGVGAAEKAAV